MPYTPPSYEALQDVTSKLQDLFNKESHRYRPPVYGLLCERVANMRKVYLDHVSKKPNLFFALSPDPVRLEEIACITRLRDSLLDSGAATEQNQIQNILLGALFYRRLAIKTSYAETAVGKVLALVPTFVSSWFSRENTSAMYQTLGETLDLGPEGMPDDLSIATCCRAYRDYLGERRAVIGSAYIRDEADFFIQLDRFITVADEGANEFSRPIKQLIAIQSVAVLLRKTDAELCKGLLTFSDRLAIKLKTKEHLSREEMIASIPASLSPQVSSLIAYLLPDDMEINKGEFLTLVDTLKGRLAVHSQYTLLGAYVILLQSAHVGSSPLLMTLNKALGTLRPGNALDDKARCFALVALRHYLALPGMSPVDFAAWPGGYEGLQRVLDEQCAELSGIDALATSVCY